jgi:general stress protein YciG
VRKNYSKETSNARTNNASSNRSQSNNSGRGFASMDPEEQKRIASKGGRAAHEQGTAHEWDSEEAKQAGQKGGQK